MSQLIEFALHACVIGCTCYLLCDTIVNSLNKLVPLLVSVECNKPLDSSNCNDHDGEIFCNACYRKKFGHQGYGSVLAGDGIRNSDTPRESVLSAAFNLIFLFMIICKFTKFSIAFYFLFIIVDSANWQCSVLPIFFMIIMTLASWLYSALPVLFMIVCKSQLSCVVISFW